MMISLLAQAAQDPSRLRQISEAFGDQGSRGSPAILLGILLIAIGVPLLWYAWRSAQRYEAEPSGRALLRDLGARVGLSGAQRRLLHRIGRAAGLEPALALISPSLLADLADRGRRNGLSLSGGDEQQLSHIRNRVTAHATKRR